MISFVRVDNRLIHGQVIEGWLPQLGVNRILVADDEAAANPLTRMAMGLAVPSRTRVDIEPLEKADFAAAEAAAEKTLLLVRDVRAAARARERGLRCPGLNLGNVHFAPGRVQVSASVFLAPEEVALLRALAADGVQIELRALPRDRPMTLDDIQARFGAGEPRP